MRALAALVLLVLPAAAGPEAERERDRETEAALLKRWAVADTDERRRLRIQLDELARARRFSSARPVLVDFEKRTYSLAQLFEEVLDPALALPAVAGSDDDPGLQDDHRRALAALVALRNAYAPPRPVRTGTLNLLLGYAHRALASRDLSPPARLRFFTETVRSVRDLDGRAQPDARTAWLINDRLLPGLLALARRFERNQAARATVGEAASLLYLPSILDERAQSQIAPLASGVHTRPVLLRFYREGVLDDLGRVALARSVAAQARDDAAFAAGSPPLLLELLSDARLPPRERGTVLGVVWDRLARLAPLSDTARDLLAAGHGGPPRPVGDYERPGAGGVALPRDERTFRFLSVVLLQDKENTPPVVARIVRADQPLYRPLYTQAGGARRRFVGVLLPDAAGAHADFVGPPPGLTSARDNRLLRRALRLERIALHTFGAKGEVMELCVTLPDDASEPVPARGADLSHVLALVRGRLGRTPDVEERRELLSFLLRIDTDEARALAVRHAAQPGVASELLPLAEKGYVPAARRLLERIRELGLPARERALSAALAIGAADLVLAVRRLCLHEKVGVAALAADALLVAGDASGVPLLLKHPDKYARAAGASLALRLAPLAGGLRVAVREPPDLDALAALAAGAFTKADGPVWARFSGWLRIAFSDIDKVRQARARHQPLRVGKRRLYPIDYVEFWKQSVAVDKFKEHWGGLAAWILSPADPGRGIPPSLLGQLLDALETKADDPALRDAWRDALVLLACAQYGIELHTEFLDLAHERLTRLAGTAAPPGARRKAGVLWPVWAAGEGAP